MRHLLHTLLYIVVFFTTNYGVFSQNLVPNSGFELAKKGESKFIPDIWESDFLNASYYIKCNIGSCNSYHGNGKPRKVYFHSQKKPKTGECYAGFFTYSYSDRRGYWGIQLIDTLTKGNYYNVELYVCRYNKFDIWIKDLEVLFTDSKPNFIYTKYAISNKDYLLFNNNRQIIQLTNENNTWLNKDKNEWIKISGKYSAKGNENYITIGNFKNNANTEHLCNRMHSLIDSIAYYFIDDISITEISDFNIDEIVINQHITLNNIYFETSKYSFLSQSYTELNKLLTLLKNNPKLQIKIEGHTDNIGSDDYNKILSENRAKSVVNYLFSKGINYNRVKYKGYGSSNPKFSNKTNKGRSGNRRVEFVILSK